VYIYARVIKRGKRGATSDGGERFLLLFSVGKWKSTKQKSDFRCPDGLRTSREYKRNEDDDDEDDDGDFIGNV
jgi:hypothetical protein